MQAVESEAVMGRFYSVYERLSQALESMRYDDFGISDEEKQQVQYLSIYHFSTLLIDT